MNNKAVAFRARARTIDHLGKGQIADCPTAVSELWKNAYDAYARDVALHTFDGTYKCGVIADNGCGMTGDQLIDSWLVVGTESKSRKKVLPARDRFGLVERKTQGEKGIGRLSTAFLSPVTLLVTKKTDSNYSTALIDWRLFENTYLSLDDITVPIAELEDISLLGEIFSQLVLELKGNLCILDKNKKLSEREKEIRGAWDRFSQDELEFCIAQKRPPITTQERIISFCDNFEFNPKMVQSWLPLLERVEQIDGEKHGTALFLLELERDLSLLTNSGSLARDNEELESIKKDLVDTLRAFVDPFKQDEDPFSYEIKSFGLDGRERAILRQTDVFDKDSFLSLEHVVQGSIDERGWFHGRVKAFGKDMGEIKFSPSIEIDRAGTKVGPFHINIGTFEMVQGTSTHTKSEHSFLLEQVKKHSGLMIFRDGLRVLPYGRVDNDFFEIEEKRSLNAGKYYWSKRRIFGRILISQDENSLLKDKAGREGFIKNQAARELKSIISSVLNDLADRFFGSKSEARQELLEILKREKESRKAAQTIAKRMSQKAFVEELKRKGPILIEQLERIKTTRSRFENTAKINEVDLERLEQDLLQFERLRGELTTPVKPPVLGDNEEKYRSYRDTYTEFSMHLFQAKEVLNRVTSELKKSAPVETAKMRFERNQALLNAQVGRYIGHIEDKLNNLSEQWKNAAQNDRSQYHQDALSIVANVSKGADLERSLNALDAVYSNLADAFTIKYESLLKALNRLEDGVNLDSAFSMAEEEKAYFEEKAKNLQALAQLGISVEILAHELEELDALVVRGLNSLPNDIKKNHPGFQAAYNAQKALTQQIRFLSPLKLSGYQMRREITGKDIQDHILKFFGDRFSRQRVELKFGDAFLKMSIRDLPSRIFPVFVNILNNAMYWVCLVDKRLIQIDVIGNEVVIANSGPEVDEDDVPRLFELFYSRRSNGHGVGLYLCKENLAVARHKIRYSLPEDIKLISGGANFIITFNGMETNQ